MLVLIGDDDRSMLDLAEVILTDAGHEVQTYSYDADLVDAALEFGPDLVVSDYDYGMCGTFENGVAVLQAIRAAGSTARLVIFSGLDRPDAVEAGFEVWLKDSFDEFKAL